MRSIPLAFYAPLKPPDHPHPSGDRYLARLLMKALAGAGFEVRLASRFRSRDGRGDPLHQRRIQGLGERLAQRLIRHYHRLPADLRPRLWFTYHLYHKAPDWLGPAVSRALGIPYVVAEASYAPKQLNGPWDLGVRASLEALRQAQRVFCLNPVDQQCIAEALPQLRLETLPPFLELTPTPDQRHCKQQLAQRWQLDPSCPWLITVAMMRPGDKSHSYQLLAQALQQLQPSPWQLLIIGDGSNAETVRGYFSQQPKVRFLGQLGSDELHPLLSASDLFVWPAVNEAFGIALLEAQAAGTAVLAGREGGVASIVIDGKTAILVPPRDPAQFAQALQQLLQQPAMLEDMGRAAAENVIRQHSLESAIHRLRSSLMPLLSRTPE